MPDAVTIRMLGYMETYTTNEGKRDEKIKKFY